ncbi:MAG TPA: hypothetical protein VK718_06145 [Ferruginibacter sp.]|jgi:hypothetical protein|nr:hypothetical protein [Ferruginibacter sp.]
MTFSISSNIMRIHFLHFGKSLKRFPEKYHHLFFETGSAVPEHYSYVCPLCITNSFMISKEGLHFNNDFSLDHFPPESSGGKQKILVCKKCNNEAGYLYDYILKEKLDHVSFNKKIPFSEILAKSEITDVRGWYHTAITIREDGETEISFKPNPKKVLPPLDNWLERSKLSFDWKANLTIEIPDEKKVSKALLKAAYLYCFLNFGYEFIYSANGELFRKVINGEVEYPIRIPTFWLDDNITISNGSTMPIGLCFITNPIKFRSLAVNLSLKLKTTGYQCTVTILIPNPTDMGIPDLIKVQNEIENNPGENISFVFLKNYLQENIMDAYSQTWTDLLTEYPKPINSY